MGRHKSCSSACPRVNCCTMLCGTACNQAMRQHAMQSRPTANAFHTHAKTVYTCARLKIELSTARQAHAFTVHADVHGMRVENMEHTCMESMECMRMGKRGACTCSD
eukprot:365213-Chlamydomonas_euryale.AAC.8